MHQSNRSIETERTERIEELIERVAALEIETRNLTQELKTLTNTTASTQRNQSTNRTDTYKRETSDIINEELDTLLEADRKA
jgi:hypothetical protein